MESFDLRVMRQIDSFHHKIKMYEGLIEKATIEIETSREKYGDEGYRSVLRRYQPRIDGYHQMIARTQKAIDKLPKVDNV